MNQLILISSPPTLPLSRSPLTQQTHHILCVVFPFPLLALLPYGFCKYLFIPFRPSSRTAALLSTNTAFQPLSEVPNAAYLVLLPLTAGGRPHQSNTYLNARELTLSLKILSPLPNQGSPGMLISSFRKLYSPKISRRNDSADCPFGRFWSSFVAQSASA